MKHTIFPADTLVPSIAAKVRRQALLQQASVAATGFAASCAGAAAGGLAAFALGAEAGIPAAIGATLAYTASSVVTSRRLSRIAAELIGRPVDTLVSQLVLAGDTSITQMACLTDASLTPASFAADLDHLERQLACTYGNARAALAAAEGARDQANLQNLAKSRFLANMSHDLRTPLNAILGYAMLLSEDANDSGNKAMVTDLDRIQQAGRHLLSLINDILDLSKIEADKITPERAMVDVGGLVRAVTETFAPTSVRNGNEFAVEVAEDVGMMMGDATRIRQCLDNLLGNAFKFSTGGTVSLTVGLTAGHQNMAFTVRDSGIGIDPAKIEGLFEAFSQADERPANRQGVGLGLAIARRLARLMGGDITAESVKGAGSTFTLTLPVGVMTAPRNARIEGATSCTEVADAVAEVKAHSKVALVIDDNESSIDLMRRWLSRMNYGVMAATNGDDGLAIARLRKPDMIILDVLMPGRSGYDVLEELRRDPTTAETPVILVTVEDDRLRGLEAGATEHIRKPVAEDQLRRMLDVYLVPGSGDILVIEDDDDAADLVRRCAEQVGFTTRRAVDGQDGLDQAMAQRPCAIVLDLAMPKLNGFDVIERLTASECLRTVPVIVLSAGEISIDQHRQIANAGYRFYAKATASPREIAQQLREMVQ